MKENRRDKGEGGKPALLLFGKDVEATLLRLEQEQFDRSYSAFEFDEQLRLAGASLVRPVPDDGAQSGSGLKPRSSYTVGETESLIKKSRRESRQSRQQRLPDSTTRIGRRIVEFPSAWRRSNRWRGWLG